jgi:uracil-DNA glycosylase
VCGFIAVAVWRSATVFPPVADVFTAFKLTPLDGVRVVILGQDPYHGPKQAHGLSFSVCRGVQTPPSLRNMLAEARADVGIADTNHGNLENWAKQGVFMLNAVLTVEQAKPNSHKGQGWEAFTSAALAAINSTRRDVVFLLWGKPAQATAKGIDKSRHHVLTAAHPSPLSGVCRCPWGCPNPFHVFLSWDSAHNGFMGCKHYSKTNDFLKSKGLEPIDWNL